MGISAAKENNNERDTCYCMRRMRKTTKHKCESRRRKRKTRRVINLKLGSKEKNNKRYNVNMRSERGKATKDKCVSEDEREEQ